MTLSTIIVDGEHLIPDVEPAWLVKEHGGRWNAVNVPVKCILAHRVLK